MKKVKNTKSERLVNNKNRQKEIALENSLKKMKWIIAVLVVLLIVCIIIIFNKTELESKSGQTDNYNSKNIIKDTNPGNTSDATAANISSVDNNLNPVMDNKTVLNNQNASNLNPPHGQPGHRCDIPVGSPLNTPPVNTTPVNNNQTPVVEKVTEPEDQTINVQNNPNAPEIYFEKTVHDYGELKKDSDGSCEFTFKNTGKEPLILSNVKSSCGCTVPTWPKEPVLPGGSEVIKVVYDTKNVGVISKTVTVTSNAKTNPVVLNIKGNVIE